MRKTIFYCSAEPTKPASNFSEVKIELPEGGSIEEMKMQPEEKQSQPMAPCRAIKSLALKLDFLRTVELWEIYATNVLLNEEFDWDTMEQEGLDVDGFHAMWEDMATRDLAFAKTHEPTQESIDAVRYVLDYKECNEYRISQIADCPIEVAIIFASGMKFLDRIQESQEFLISRGIDVTK